MENMEININWFQKPTNVKLKNVNGPDKNIQKLVGGRDRDLMNFRRI